MIDVLNKIKNLVAGQRDLTSVGLVDITSNGIGAVFWFYIALILGAEQYGQVSYFLAIAGIASNISLLGSQNTLTVYTAKEVKIQATVYSITLIAGLVAAVSVFFILQKIEVSLLVIGYLIFNLSISEILGKKLFVAYSKYVLANKILTVVLSIGLYYLIGVQGVILGIALASFPYFIRIYQGFRESKIDFSLLKPRFSFIITSYLTYLADAFSGTLDKIIIAPLLGFVILGNYQLGIQFLAILHILPAIVYKYTLPHDATGNQNRKLKRLAILSSIAIAILGVTVAPILIPLVFPKYNEATTVIQIISPSIVPSTVTLMYMSKFLGNEKNKIILLGSVIYLVCQISSIIILGRAFGVNGAAIALDLSVTIHMIFFIIANKFVHIPQKS